jgi:carbon-monoxide dehydrogenase medium subunit
LGDEAQLLAGGTDVMIQHMRREINPSTFLYIGRLDSLRRLASNGDVTIGPLISHQTLATDSRLAANLPALAEAAGTVGSWQTQEVGTVGGNICNASPAADTVPPLLVAGASVELSSEAGRRRLPLDDFLLGRRRTDRQPTELLTDIAAEPVAPGTGETYLKLGRRSAMEVSIVGLAARLTFASANTVSSARIAVCSVAPRPYRAAEVERILESNGLDPEVIAEAGRTLVASATPIDDARSSAAYRLRVLPRLLARAIELCRMRAGIGGIEQ